MRDAETKLYLEDFTSTQYFLQLIVSKTGLNEKKRSKVIEHSSITLKILYYSLQVRLWQIWNILGYEVDESTDFCETSRSTERATGSVNPSSDTNQLVGACLDQGTTAVAGTTADPACKWARAHVGWIQGPQIADKAYYGVSAL